MVSRDYSATSIKKGVHNETAFRKDMRCLNIEHVYMVVVVD